MCRALVQAERVLFEGGLHTDFQSPKISAVSIDNVGVYPALVILNSTLSGDRERFTVADELGHLVMHDELTTSEEAEAEAEADAFAAEFLMPAAEIRVKLRNITLQRAAQLKVVWRVAMSAIIRRARDLGVVDDRRYKSLNVSISQKGWRKAEPVDVGKDEASVVSSLLAVHLSEHGYSVEELAEVVALRPDEFTARFGIARQSVTTHSRSGLRALNSAFRPPRSHVNLVVKDIGLFVLIAELDVCFDGDATFNGCRNVILINVAPDFHLGAFVQKP
jgi:Zn-dependent peptidase ImmA (M78 family)